MLRSTRTFATLSALLLAATTSAEEPPLKFAWPVPSQVRITEKVEKKGRTTVMRYQASLVAAGERLELRLSDIQMEQSVGPLGGLMPEGLLDTLMPTLVLSREGALEDVIGFERAIEAGIAMAKSTLTEPQALKAAEAVFRSPQIVAALKRKSGEYWELWVGIWHRSELQPGEDFTTDLSIPMPDGTILKQPTRIRHLGADPQVKGHVRLSFEGTLDGPAFSTAMERLMRELMKDVPVNAPPQDFLQSARRETRLTVTTEAATMRPREARSEVTTTIVVKGGETKTQVERREYQFDWGK